jgi:site-specific DNA recombinase
MTTEPTKYFIYARKSTDDPQRQVRSIDDQLAELRELAKREQLEVVHAYVEKQTAKLPGRPIFNQMIERIEKGDASGILAWHPDRLSRNSLDGGKLIYLFDTSVITSLRFPTMSVDASAQGKFVLAVMFGQSKYYVDNLSENIKRGQRHKARNGIWPMVAPVGYVNDHRTRRIVPDPERGPLVRKLFELYATGNYTIDRLTNVMTELGMTNRADKSLSRPQYHRILSNPIYYGLVEYAGESHEGQHEPLITKRLFDRCQHVMQQKSKPQSLKLKPFMYRGLLRCGECGCFITTETQKGNNYLRCTKRVKRHCSQPYVREQEVARQITDAISLVAVPPDWIDWMFAELEKDKLDEGQSLTAQLGRVRERLIEIDEKLKRLMTAYLDKAISIAEYNSYKAELAVEKLTLKQDMTELEASRIGWFEPATRFLNALKQAIFLASSDEEVQKRDFLRKYGSNLTILNKTLRVELREPFKTLEEHGRLAKHNDAPEISGASLVGQLDRCSIKRRGGDSNSRYPCGQTGFRNRRIQPLCHLSF